MPFVMNGISTNGILPIYCIRLKIEEEEKL